MDNIKSSQTVQSIQNGPVADKARQETAQVKGEFSNLANARQTPSTQTATGQPLTHYHSLFYTLLSWENPRATAISYAAIIVTIFAFRYLPIARYGLRLTWMTLGITAAAEIAGKVALGQGMASKMRPKKYYTISRDTLDSVLGDLEQLINFFVIEVQRIVFAENVYVTVGVSARLPLDYCHGADRRLGVLHRSHHLLPDQDHARLGSRPSRHHRDLLRTPHLHQQQGAHRLTP